MFISFYIFHFILICFFLFVLYQRVTKQSSKSYILFIIKFKISTATENQKEPVSLKPEVRQKKKHPWKYEWWG